MFLSFLPLIVNICDELYLYILIKDHLMHAHPNFFGIGHCFSGRTPINHTILLAKFAFDTDNGEFLSTAIKQQLDFSMCVDWNLRRGRILKTIIGHIVEFPLFSNKTRKCVSLNLFRRKGAIGWTKWPLWPQWLLLQIHEHWCDWVWCPCNCILLSYKGSRHSYISFQVTALLFTCSLTHWFITTHCNSRKL